MTTLDPLHPLQSSIVELLSEQTGMTVAELHFKLKSACAVEVSVQNLYRAIGQMLDAQMLIREKGKLSLNLVWASHFIRCADSVRRRYLATDDDIVDLPKRDGERREFFAESLGALDSIWNHVLRKVTAMEENMPWFEYNAHPYHLLGMTQTEERLYGSLGAGHKLYGNDTFLDRYGVLRNIEKSNVVMQNQTPFLKDGYSLWICGDYIVDCVLPESLTRHFAFFFQTVQTIDQFHPELFADVFKMKARCKLLVRKSASESAMLRAKFGEFFPESRTKNRTSAKKLNV